MLEREIKLRFSSPDDARKALLKAGATPLRARRLQQDALLDTDDEALRRKRSIIRIRTEGVHSILTFKGPVQPGAMKMRDELETAVADGQTLQRVLEELGLRVWFRYEKYREEYAAEGVTLAIDETPVGTFVEIEGTEAGIRGMARALGKTESDFILDSYRGLFLQHRTKYGYNTNDMFFLDDEE